MKGPILNADQRQAYGADRNVVVSAGAGSGKTMVLAERYVRLVMERGLGVDQILTLTFTRKAAAEMYSRIYRRLAQSDHPKARAQLERFDSARISTLDSFCSAIARSASHRYGIRPDFTMDEARLRHIAENTAIEILMEHRHKGVIGRLVATRTFDSVRSDFLADLALFHIPLLDHPGFKTFGEKQYAFLREESSRLLGILNELGSELLTIDASECDNKNLHQALSVLRNLIPLEGIAQNGDVGALKKKIEVLNSKEDFPIPRSTVKQAVLLEFRELALPFKEATDKLLILLEALDRREDCMELARLLDLYAQSYLTRKREEGILAFQDTSDLAVDILSQDLQLRSFYKQQIRSIMIDEFQDNNENQKNLLYLLAERDDILKPGIPPPEDLAPDKLFFVGDEKQSIYRFRGADVSVFRKLAGELDKAGSKEGSELCMDINYRSAAPLVCFFNTFFPGIFGTAMESFEASYRPMHAGPDASIQDEKATVEFHILETPYRAQSEDDSEDVLAQKSDLEALATAKRIVEGLRKKEFQYADVAILFRSTSHQNSYERIFRSIGIPFAASDPRGIFSEGPANDFYALFRLVLFPQDRNAYGTVLRSPFVRLGDDVFLRIMLDQESTPFPTVPPDSWFSRTEDRKRYLRGAEVYHRLKTQIDRQRIANLLAELWYGAGYRSVLLEEAEAASCLEHFELLYDLALDADSRHLTLATFLDELAPRMGSYEKLQGDEGSEKENAVSFMTVHKSKGLEFPVVIIADSGSRGTMEHNSKPYYWDKKFGAVVNLKDENAPRNKQVPNYFYEKGKELEEQQALAELKRLLYVAATRAQQKLMVFGIKRTNKADQDALEGLEETERIHALLSRINHNKDGEEKPKSFLDLWALGFQGVEISGGGLKLQGIPSLGLGELQKNMAFIRKELKQLGKRKPELDTTTWRTKFYTQGTLRAIKSVRGIVSPTDMEQSFDTFRTVREGRALPSLSIDAILAAKELEAAFGTLCHGMIDMLLSGQKPVVPPELRESFRKAGLGNSDRESLETEALLLAQAFIKTPTGQEALAAPRRRTEFPFILPLTGTGDPPILVHGSMDLIYEHITTCVIVDFKTDRVMDIEAHRVQMDCYRNAAKAFSDLPVEVRLFYLRNMESTVVEPRLDQDVLYRLAKKVRLREEEE